MLRVLILILALFLGLISGQSRCPAAQANCQSATTTAEMRACANARYETANRKLETVYSQLINSLSADRKEKLRAAESAWLIFRQKNADFSASAAEGGTLAPLLRISTFADMTEQRLQELTRLIQK